MKRLLITIAIGLVFATAASAAPAVNLGLGGAGWVNFDGNGHFDQSVAGTLILVDGYWVPAPIPVGTEVFGVGTISGVALMSDLGTPVWLPGDVGPDFEMTFSFWDAVVTSSSGNWVAGPGSTWYVEATYTNEAHILLVQDHAGDFTVAAGPNLFDKVDGEFLTAYTLEDAGYDVDGAPDAASEQIVPDDANELVFLDLTLSGNTSFLTFNAATGTFLNAAFSGTIVEIVGGGGAGQFMDFPGSDGAADSFIINFTPTASGWEYGGDIDIQLFAIPAPTALISLMTGLVCLSGYGLRRWRP